MSHIEPQGHFPRGKLSDAWPLPRGYKCGRSVFVWALLLALVIADAANASPRVLSGTCKPGADTWCINSLVELKGEELGSVKSVLIGSTAAEQQSITCTTEFRATADAVSCIMAVQKSTNAGLYPVTLVLDDDSQVEGGSLAVGAFLGAHDVSGWTKTTPSSRHKVTGQSSDWPSTGDAWSVDGVFEPSTTYEVVFYNMQPDAAAGNPSTVTCDKMEVTETKLTCIITAVTGVMGMFRFLVKDTKENALLLGSTSLYSIAVNPPLPVTSGAAGACATSSKACTSGAELTIFSTHFNYRDPAYQKFFVGVTAAQQSAIRFEPTAVNKSSVTVRLTVDENVPAGIYPVFVKLQVCAMGMMSPGSYVGYVVLKSDSTKGFDTSIPSGSLPENDDVSDHQIGGKPAGYVAAVVLASVFGVLVVLLLITLTFMCVRHPPLRNVAAEDHSFWRMGRTEGEAASQRKDAADEMISLPRV
ncbi:hypothetical protein JKF63_02127 [Porcisia hertigi]|uniref:Uncharacterized protein n=1 Tax=Porcisia hertigi TaxID=2761500 RepID=A0A836HLQ2_9TRYP|nr:hypothetical protein JKF63_02127 [Porcisia hertigi]